MSSFLCRRLGHDSVPSHELLSRILVVRLTSIIVTPHDIFGEAGHVLPPTRVIEEELLRSEDGGLRLLHVRLGEACFSSFGHAIGGCCSLITTIRSIQVSERALSHQPFRLRVLLASRVITLHLLRF